VKRNAAVSLPLHERGACHRDPQARDMRRNSALAALRLVAARTDGADGFLRADIWLQITAAGWVNATRGTALKVTPTQWQVQVERQVARVDVTAPQR
jgi:hypothetical protein